MFWCTFLSLLSFDSPLYWFRQPYPLFFQLQSRVCYWDFFWGYPVFTTEIWSVYISSMNWAMLCSLFTQVLCERGWHCGYVLSSLHERSIRALHRLDPLLLLETLMYVDRLLPNTATEAENSRCVPAIWILRGKKFCITGLSSLLQA